MPKGKGRKAGKAKRQLTTPGLTNTPKRTTTPEPKQLATPDATPRAGRVTLGPFKKQGLVATIEEEDEDEEYRDGEASDSEDSWGETRDVQVEAGLAKAGLVARCIAKGNPPGFLDSEDEAELEEAGWREFKRRGEYTFPEQWGEIGEFLLHRTAVLLGATHSGDEICVMDEILGGLDGKRRAEAKIVSPNG